MLSPVRVHDEGGYRRSRAARAARRCSGPSPSGRHDRARARAARLAALRASPRSAPSARSGGRKLSTDVPRPPVLLRSARSSPCRSSTVGIHGCVVAVHERGERAEDRQRVHTLGERCCERGIDIGSAPRSTPINAARCRPRRPSRHTPRPCAPRARGRRRCRSLRPVPRLSNGDEASEPAMRSTQALMTGICSGSSDRIDVRHEARGRNTTSTGPSPTPRRRCGCRRCARTGPWVPSGHRGTRRGASPGTFARMRPSSENAWIVMAVCGILVLGPQRGRGREPRRVRCSTSSRSPPARSC